MIIACCRFAEAVDDPALIRVISVLQPAQQALVFLNAMVLGGVFERHPELKVVFTETNLDIATYALELQGPRGVLETEDPDAVDAGRWQEAFLYARGFTISAGSNEIMRNLISERALKLPRDPAK